MHKNHNLFVFLKSINHLLIGMSIHHLLAFHTLLLGYSNKSLVEGDGSKFGSKEIHTDLQINSEEPSDVSVVWKSSRQPNNTHHALAALYQPPGSCHNRLDYCASFISQ